LATSQNRIYTQLYSFALLLNGDFCFISKWSYKRTAAAFWLLQKCVHFHVLFYFFLSFVWSFEKFIFFCVVRDGEKVRNLLLMKVNKNFFYTTVYSNTTKVLYFFGRKIDTVFSHIVCILLFFFRAQFTTSRINIWKSNFSDDIHECHWYFHFTLSRLYLHIFNV